MALAQARLTRSWKPTAHPKRASASYTMAVTTGRRRKNLNGMRREIFSRNPWISTPSPPEATSATNSDFKLLQNRPSALSPSRMRPSPSFSRLSSFVIYPTHFLPGSSGRSRKTRRRPEKGISFFLNLTLLSTATKFTHLPLLSRRNSRVRLISNLVLPSTSASFRAILMAPSMRFSSLTRARGA